MDPFTAVPAGDEAVKQCWGGSEMKELSAADFTVCIQLQIHSERHCRLPRKSRWTWVFLGLQGVWGGQGPQITASLFFHGRYPVTAWAMLAQLQQDRSKTE